MPQLQQLQQTPNSRISTQETAIVRRALATINDALSGNDAFLVGAQLSSADISLWVLVTELLAYVTLDQLDAAKKWYDSIGALPAVAAARAEFPTVPNSLIGSNQFGGFRASGSEVIDGISNGKTPVKSDFEFEWDAKLSDSCMLVAEKRFEYEEYVVQKEPRTV